MVEDKYTQYGRFQIQNLKRVESYKNGLILG